MIRLGIIGCGGIAMLHAKNILSGQCPEVRVTAVADRLEARRAWAAGQFPDAAVFCEGSDLIAARPCDAVLIATPHYQHPTLSVQALDGGLHVLSEKPAGVYTLQVREAIAAADRHPELTYALMYNQRTNCVYRKAKAMIDGGEIGQMKRVNWIITDWYRAQSYYDAGAWRATWDGEGGGVLLNQCPHQLDLLQWLCGLPARVRAFTHEGKWHDIEVEDDVTCYMEFENGATGVFIASTGDAPGENRLEILGTRGRLLVESDQLTKSDRLTFARNETDERDWCFADVRPFAAPKCEIVPVETDGQNGQHAAVLNAFAAHILRGEPLVADGREGIRGLMLSNAMHLSGWTGETVSLPIDEHRFLQLLNRRRAVSRHKEVKDVAMDTAGSFGSAQPNNAQ